MLIIKATKMKGNVLTRLPNILEFTYKTMRRLSNMYLPLLSSLTNKINKDEYQ